MRTVTAPGRWIWSLSGVVTLAVIGISGAQYITGLGSQGGVGPTAMTAVPSQVMTAPALVTSLRVESYGAPIQVTAAPVSDAQIMQSVEYGSDMSGPPTVNATVTGDVLTVSAPACADGDCSVGFTVTVPEKVTVTAASDGGDITLSGVASANLDSAGGDVFATGIRGPLTVNTEDGTLTLNGLTGTLNASTGGGNVVARDVAAAKATVTTENGEAQIGFAGRQDTVTVLSGGGDAQLWFAAPPRTVTVNTEGGAALLSVPGGPYALTTDAADTPQTIEIATAPGASRSINVTTAGGPVQIEPPGQAGPIPPLQLNAPPAPPAQPGQPGQPAQQVQPGP